MSHTQRRYLLEALGLFLVVVVVAQLVGPFQMQVVATAVIFAMAGVGLNILVGYTGLVSLGHIAFLAIGAYGWALMAPTTSVVVAIVAPVLISLVLAAAIAAVTMRVAGYYFAITTLGVGMLALVFVENATSVTRGFTGITNVLQTGLPGLTGGRQVLITAALVLAIFYFVQCTLRDSPIGAAMLTIRFDPLAARSFGISVRTVRVVAFAVSSIPVTIAGSFLAQLDGYVGPALFILPVSVQLLAIPIIGGRGWRWAPIAGALVVIALPELIRALEDYRLVFYGFALAAVGLFLPQGISQLASLATPRRRQRPTKITRSRQREKERSTT